MKTKIFITGMFFFSLTDSYAQLYNKQVENKWQIGLSLNTIEDIQNLGATWDVYEGGLNLDHRNDMSFNAGIFISYKVQQNFAVRLSAKMTDYNIKVYEDTRDLSSATGNAYTRADWTIKSSIINISPGILWSFNYKEINPYGGFELVYKKYNDLNATYIAGNYDKATNNAIDGGKSIVKEAEGFSVGAGPFIGFSVKVLKNISIGTEFSSAFSYNKLGGEIHEVDTDLVSNAITTRTNQQTKEGFRFLLAASVNLSINF